MVIVEGISPALIGIATGTIAALASAKVMKSLTVRPGGSAVRVVTVRRS